MRLFRLIAFSTLMTSITAQLDNPYEAIRNVLANYPLAIDGKDFSMLSEVFTQDAVANYSDVVGVLTGLPAIERVLQSELRPVSTQHSYGTQQIIIHPNNTANTVTYYTASQFGSGLFTDQVAYSYGKYVDHLVLKPEGWRVDRRHLVYMGPLVIGNPLVFTSPTNGTGAPAS